MFSDTENFSVLLGLLLAELFEIIVKLTNVTVPENGIKQKSKKQKGIKHK